MLALMEAFQTQTLMPSTATAVLAMKTVLAMTKQRGSPPSDSNKLHEEAKGSLAVGLGGVHGSQWEDSCPLGCLVALRGVLLEVLNHLVHLHRKLMPHFHDGILHTKTHNRRLGFRP
jgi:hypothetical protein